MASAGEASEGGVRLLLVGSPPDVTRVEAAAEACVAARRHLLVLFRGDAAGEGPGARDDDRDDEAREEASRRKKGVRRNDRNARTARDLESACDAIARVAPVLEFTPLLMELGWDEKSARARADALARPSNEVVVDDATQSGAAFRDSFLHKRRPTDVGSRGGFAKVSVGGTFDRLHAGHRLLLAAAALVTDARSGTLYVGVTGEALLANKSDKNKIQPYETRARNARRFLESVLASPKNAKMRVEMGPLDGAPPLASTVQDMCALVVSRETLAGAAAVNAQREARGFPPLEIVAVGVVGGVGDDDEARRRSKLSSSALRAAAE